MRIGLVGLEPDKLPAPRYNYTVEYDLALIHSEIAPRGYSIWDNGSAYDNRILNCEWLLKGSDAQTLITSLKSMRTSENDLQITPERYEDFFPAGPEIVRNKSYSVDLIALEVKEVQQEPWLYFNISASFYFKSAFTVDTPAQIAEGDLNIGTIEDLRYEFPVRSENLYNTSLGKFARGRLVSENYIIDKSTDAVYSGSGMSAISDSDKYITTIKMICNHSKAGALINHLVNTVRGAAVDIDAPADTYLFGREIRDGNGQQTFSCNMMNSKISVTHTNFDRFEFELTFYLRDANL